MSDQFTQQELEQAVSAYLKRQAYNKSWRARNADKVSAYHQRYNAEKNAKLSEAIKQACANGLCVHTRCPNAR